MLNIIIRTVISIGIILLAIFLGKALIGTKEPPVSKQPPAVIPQVETLLVEAGNYRPEVRSFGNVQSFFETTLTPQVSGRIMSVSSDFRVGELVREGEVLALIDDTDYQAALSIQKANIILQERALAEEEIRAKQAAEDWIASGRKLSSASEFVLRKPQLAAARANIDAVTASIKKANADIKRTKIVAPYDAIITERSASVGNFANAQSSLGKLVATEKAEVRIPLTAEQMKRIQFSEGKKPILTLTIPSNETLKWKAEFSRMEPTVDPRNQVSYAIATIKNPYKSKSETLPVGSFVNVSLPAIEIQDAYKIPEAALVNDRYLWVVDAEYMLIRLDATRVHSADSYAYVKIKTANVKSPIRLIKRPLSTFRSGSKVRWEKKKSDAKTKARVKQS